MNPSQKIAKLLAPATPRDAVEALFGLDDLPVNALQLLLESGTLTLDAANASRYLQAFLRKQAKNTLSHSYQERERKKSDDPPFPDTLDGEWPEAHACTERLVAVLWAASEKNEADRQLLRQVAIEWMWEKFFNIIMDPKIPFPPLSPWKDGEGFLPWTHAVVSAHDPLLLDTWLKNPQANPFEVDSQGRNALFQCHRYPQCARLLLDRGVDGLATDNGGGSVAEAWHRALYSYEDRKKSLDLLREYFPEAGTEHGTLVTQWLDNGLPKEAFSGKAPLLVKRNSDGRVISWGALAWYMQSDKQQYNQLPSLSAALHQASDAVLFHESLPGVADGWIAEAKLSMWLAERYTKKTVADDAALKELHGRLDTKGTTRGWRALQVCKALRNIDHPLAEKLCRFHFPWQGHQGAVVDWFQTALDERWPSELWAGRDFGSNVLEAAFKQVPVPDANDTWAKLLAIFYDTKSSRSDGARRVLVTLMESLVKRQLMPTNFASHTTHAHAKSLERQVKGKDWIQQIVGVAWGSHAKRQLSKVGAKNEKTLEKEGVAPRRRARL